MTCYGELVNVDCGVRVCVIRHGNIEDAISIWPQPGGMRMSKMFGKLSSIPMRDAFTSSNYFRWCRVTFRLVKLESRS